MELQQEWGKMARIQERMADCRKKRECVVVALDDDFASIGQSIAN